MLTAVVLLINLLGNLSVLARNWQESYFISRFRLLLGDISMAGISLSLIFIDSALNDEQILSTIPLPEAEAIILDSHRDGLEQITEILAKRRGIGNLYIVSQGSASSLQLGSSYLTRFNLDRYGWHLQAWGDALAPDAHITLYACTALGEHDKTLVRRLSLLTGAQVSSAGYVTDNRMLKLQQGGDAWLVGF